MKKALLTLVILGIFILQVQAQEGKTEELQIKMPSLSTADDWALYFAETNPEPHYSFHKNEPLQPHKTQTIYVRDKRNDDLVKAVIYANIIFEGIDLGVSLHARHKYGANFVEVNPIGNFFLHKGDGAFIGWKVVSTAMIAWGTWELYKKKHKWGMVAAFSRMGFQASVVVWNIGQSQKFNKR